MIARGAMWDVSIFEEKRVPVDDLVKEYLRIVSLLGSVGFSWV